MEIKIYVREKKTGKARRFMILVQFCANVRHNEWCAGEKQLRE